MPKGKPPGRGFAKGVSGNPSGRPKDHLKLKNLCAEHGPRAVQILVEAMENAPEWSDRIKAAKEILDRGFGKPAQALDLSSDDGTGITVIIGGQTVVSGAES